MYEFIMDNSIAIELLLGLLIMYIAIAFMTALAEK